MLTTVSALTEIVNACSGVGPKTGDSSSQARHTLEVTRSTQWRTLGGRILWLVKYTEVVRGWSGREFGRQAGVSSSYAKDIARRIDEEGLDPKMSTLYALADGADVSVSWLVDNDGWPDENSREVYKRNAPWPWDKGVEPAESQAQYMALLRERRKQAAKEAGNPPDPQRPRRKRIPKQSDVVEKDGAPPARRVKTRRS